MTHKGFHLIELLICLVIISILSAVTFSLYTPYFIKLRRIEAVHMLANLSLALEEYHMMTDSYASATLSLLKIPEWIAENYYHLLIRSATQHDYTIMAIPLGQQKRKDKLCGTLIQHASGEKKITGRGQLKDCW